MHLRRSSGTGDITARKEHAGQYCERHAALDVLIVDVKLRGSRSGAQVASELMAFHPDVGMIFVSGTSLDDLRGEGLLDIHQFPSERTSCLEHRLRLRSLCIQLSRLLEFGAASKGRPSIESF